MIQVTKTYLPSFDKYVSLIKEAWDNTHITNNGPFVCRLEGRLKEYLKVENLGVYSNGTIVIQMALKGLNIKKEVITTPFSYVATTNAILWESCKPVYVDINKSDFCIDAEKIEAAITPNTEAILATHVYGNPCDTEKIEAIAKQYNLKVIYDAAHAFGSLYKGQSVLNFGDVSTCSFHATKIFHTVEGGCIISKDPNLFKTLIHYRQFGHTGDEYFSIGINGKNSEFHAAMGLCVLDDIAQIISMRKERSEWYDDALQNLHLTRPKSKLDDVVYNYAYYPVVFESESSLLEAKAALEKEQIYCRRYFYPSLNKLPFFTGEDCPIAEDIATRVLCLPLFHDLQQEVILKIGKIIKSVI